MSINWSKESNTAAASVSSTASTIFQIDSGESFLIKNAGSTNILSLTESTGDFSILGDITIAGHDINDSGGTTALSLSGANVTVKGSLTIDGNSLTFGNGEIINNSTDGSIQLLATGGTDSVLKLMGSG